MADPQTPTAAGPDAQGFVYDEAGNVDGRVTSPRQTEIAAQAAAIEARRSPQFCRLLSLGPYEIHMDLDAGWYPLGPGTGFTPPGGYLFPHTRFPTRQLTEQVAACMNDAYRSGYQAAQRDIRAALGLVIS